MTGGQITALVGLVLIVAGLLVLRRTRPVWYWVAFGAPAKLIRIASTYRSVMEACGLTEPPSASGSPSRQPRSGCRPGWSRA